MYDIIVVGAGPAGMTAALYSLRAGKSVLLLEKENCGGQIVQAPLIENYPGMKQVSGFELAEMLLEQVSALGAEIEQAEVIAIRGEKKRKIVVTDSKEYECGAVIIACGVQPRCLGLDNEPRLLGNGISYCAVCDGAFYEGKAAAVVGGGSSALQEALFLSNICSEVFLIHRRAEFRAEDHLIQQVHKKNNIRELYNSQITALLGEEELTGITVCDNTGECYTQLNVAVVFVAIGKVPDNQRFAELLYLDQDGYIISDEEGMTSQTGIFAAGDCRQKQLRQLTTAVADGAVAAVNACRYLDWDE